MKFYRRNKRLVWLLVAVLVFALATGAMYASDNADVDRLATGILTVAAAVIIAIVTGVRIAILEDSAQDLGESILNRLKTEPIWEVLSDIDKQALERLRNDAGVEVTEFAEFIIRKYADRINRPR